MATASARIANRASVSAQQTFAWQGTDKRGHKLKGEELGRNANLVKAHLRRQGINATKVVQKKKSIFGKAGKAIKGQDIAIFSRMMATMMKAGVPLVQSVEMIAGGTKNPRLADLLTSIKVEIESGSALS